MNQLIVQNVCKKLDDTQVLDNINLSLESGRIYGLIGTNGSGKTMLLRLLGGVMKPTSGDLFLNGEKLEDLSNSNYKVGLVIEHASMYPDFTGFTNLMFLAKINNYIGEAEVGEAIKRVGLDPNDKRKVKKYSLGMKQRLAIAQAIMEKPDFLFLDEPTNALDEDGIYLSRKIIMEEAKRGAIIVMASHNEEDVKVLCQDIYYMMNGKIYNKKETVK